MSGHSKWNNIKRKKEKTDGARAKVFTKIGREISVAVRDGGPNPASNSKLADLIAKAKRMSCLLYTSDAADGWCCVTVDGWPLGGGKVSGGRVKNHYPKALRLL